MIATDKNNNNTILGRLSLPGYALGAAAHAEFSLQNLFPFP